VLLSRIDAVAVAGQSYRSKFGSGDTWVAEHKILAFRGVSNFYVLVIQVQISTQHKHDSARRHFIERCGVQNRSRNNGIIAQPEIRTQRRKKI